jgi:gliding motility-associated-like protein
VNVSPLPDLSYTVSDSIGCEPFTITFASNHTEAANDSARYQWRFADGHYIDMYGASSQVDNRYRYAGKYTPELIITSSFGCSDSVTGNAIIIQPVPEAVFTFDPPRADFLNPGVTFTDKSKGAFLYDWDFGDNFGQSTMQHPKYSYNDTGDYNVRLVVTSPLGCTDTSLRIFRVEEVYKVYIPNSFTPDGDNLNDVFAPRLMGADVYNLKIFNRWGSLIYDSGKEMKPWNGELEGDNLAAPGAYFYVITVDNRFGLRELFKGAVMLIR